MTNPFFNVVRKPLTTEFNGEEIEIGKDVLINSQTGNVLGVVTPTYKVVTNEEVNNLVNKILEGIPILKTTDHLNGKTTHWIREIVLDGEQFTHRIDGNDILKTMVIVSNGYDTFTPVSIKLSIWRKKCGNVMLDRRKTFTSYYRHMTEDVVNRIKCDFERHSDKLKGSIKLWEKWSKKEFKNIDFNEFIEKFSDEPENRRSSMKNNKNTIFSANQAEGIKALYKPIMSQYNEKETLYGAYNVLTEIATHHTKAHKGSHVFSAKYKKMQRVINKFYEKYADIE